MGQIILRNRRKHHAGGIVISNGSTVINECNSSEALSAFSKTETGNSIVTLASFGGEDTFGYDAGAYDALNNAILVYDLFEEATPGDRQTITLKLYADALGASPTENSFIYVDQWDPDYYLIAYYSSGGIYVRNIAGVNTKVCDFDLDKDAIVTFDITGKNTPATAVCDVWISYDGADSILEATGVECNWFFTGSTGLPDYGFYIQIFCRNNAPYTQGVVYLDYYRSGDGLA